MDDLEALRRRLYRPDASAEDLARYAQRTQVPEPVVPTAPRRRSPLPRVLIGVTVVLGLGTALAIVRTPAARLPVAAEAPPPPTASTILPTQRVGVSIDGLAKTAQRVEGDGAAEVAVDLTGASFAGGRFTVLLSSADRRPLGWSAHVLEARRDWTFDRRTIANGAVRDRFGVTRPDEVAYPGSPPRWITVQAPADAVWTLTVAFADGHDVALH